MASGIMTQIIEILVSGIVGIGEGIGSGLSALVGSVFLTGTGDSQTLSAFGTLVIIFAGISLAMGLTRWVLNFVTSLGARNS